MEDITNHPIIIILLVFLIAGIFATIGFSILTTISPAVDQSGAIIHTSECVVFNVTNITESDEEPDCGLTDSDYVSLVTYSLGLVSNNCTVLDWRNATLLEPNETCDCGCDDSESKIGVEVANCTDWSEWLDGYEYRKELGITGSDGAGTDYYINLSIGESSGGDFDLEGNCENYPDDIRFTSSDGVTELNYYIVNLTVDPVSCWIEVADNLSSNATIYIYYGNSEAESASELFNVTFTYNGSVVTYGTVLSQGRWWLDRNLGAEQVATAYNDYLGYGDLFQWGRLDDGHQSITWTDATHGTPDYGSTTDLSTTDVPGHNLFIKKSDSPYDWRNPKNDDLWQGVNGVNNPSPAGWRIPTETEWETERLGWSSNNRSGAYNSPLKLVVNGYRFYSNGLISEMGINGYYWSSTRIPPSTNARTLTFYSDNAAMSSYGRAAGFSVRCTKNTVSPEPALANVGDEDEPECLLWGNVSYGTICFDEYHTPAPENPDQTAWFTSECETNDSIIIAYDSYTNDSGTYTFTSFHGSVWSTSYSDVVTGIGSGFSLYQLIPFMVIISIIIGLFISAFIMQKTKE